MQTNSQENFDVINILYVDNDEYIKKKIESAFKLFQCNIDFCEDSQSVGDRIKENRYHIVLINVAALKNGLALAKEVLSINEKQAIIFISKSDDARILYNSIQLHISGYIFLPLEKKNIVDVISKVAHKLFMKQKLEAYNEELEKLVEKKTQELFYKSFHDSMTGLKNHFALNELLQQEHDMHLFLLNVDHFGDINNAYGFTVGDHVLQEISKLLTIVKPSNAQLFRLNSDEFVFTIEEQLSDEELKQILNSIEYFFNETEVSLDENIDTRISFSIGVSTGYGTELLHNAKIAIMELREHNRGTYNFFDEKSLFLTKQQSNIYWIHKIKESISTGNLFPYYQPIVNNKTGQIEKYECLARIDDLDTLIPPIRFMEAAKVTGMLPHITRTIIQQSFESFAQNDYEFSINITSEDLYTEYLEAFLLRNAKKYGIDPSRVVLEILEDIASLKESSTIEQLSSLREKGFKIAIDDFGSQSSNFSRLLEFSPDYLKIDGSFIKNLIHDEKSRIICEAIVLISHKSNIKVIAEYVHSKEVQEAVKAMGIDYSQGFFFGKPDHILL